MVGLAAIFLEFVKLQEFDIVPGIVLAVDVAGFERVMGAVEIQRVHIGAERAEEILIQSSIPEHEA